MVKYTEQQQMLALGGIIFLDAIALAMGYDSVLFATVLAMLGGVLGFRVGQLKA